MFLYIYGKNVETFPTVLNFCPPDCFRALQTCKEIRAKHVADENIFRRFSATVLISASLITFRIHNGYFIYIKSNKIVKYSVDFFRD